MGADKEESLWLREWTCPFELVEMLESWITDYDEHYLHSALTYKTPREIVWDYHSGRPLL